MARALNRCFFTAGSSGTGHFDDGTAVQGFRNLSAAGAQNGVVYSYVAENSTRTQVEFGRATYNSGSGQLERSDGTIEWSTNSNARVNFTDPPFVLITRLAQDVVENRLNDNQIQVLDEDDFASDSASAVPTQQSTKAYIHAVVAVGVRRGTVRVATTANITIATALNNGDTLDGVTLATNDLVLVKNQSSSAENGVYVVGVTPVRASEFDTYNEHPGALLAVQEGTTNADTLWLCTSNTGGTLNSTAIAFTNVGIVVSASTTVAGISELADTTETDAHSDTARTVTPAGLANHLKGNAENQTLAGGADVTSKSLGTVSTGTVTLDCGDRSLQHYTNNGAHVLSPGSVTGSMVLDITNGASAGAITFTGWTITFGTTLLTTTNTNKFRLMIVVGNGGSSVTVMPLQ